MEPITQKPKLLRPILYTNVILDGLVAIGLLVAYAQLFATSYKGVDGGFAITLGVPFYIVPAALTLLDGYALYRRLNNVSRKLFTYYAVTRSVLLLGAMYYFYQYVSYDSTGGSGYNSVYFPFIVAFALLFGSSGLAIYRAVKGVWQAMLLSAVVVGVIAGSAYMHLAVGRSNSGAGSGLAGTRRDNQTARDFQLLSQDVENYALGHHNFPVSLSQVVSARDSLSAEENPASRLDRYDYKYDDKTGEYELCATFFTVANDPRASGFIKAYNHKKGHQCFSFKIDNWASWAAGRTPSDKPSAGSQPAQNQGAQIYNY